MENIGFSALLRSKGYNQKRLAEEAEIPPGVLCHRINGRTPWQWPEVGRVCETLGITLDDFAGYFPVGNVPAAQHRQQAEKAELEAMRNLLAAFKAAAKAVG